MPNVDTLLAEDALAARLIDGLTPAERSEAVVHVMLDPIPAGTSLHFGPTVLYARWSALLAFVDQQPLAGWAHPCRYVLINRATGETESTSGRFPPFQSGASQRWRIVYQAPNRE